VKIKTIAIAAMIAGVTPAWADEHSQFARQLLRDDIERIARRLPANSSVTRDMVVKSAAVWFAGAPCGGGFSPGAGLDVLESGILFSRDAPYSSVIQEIIGRFSVASLGSEPDPDACAVAKEIAAPDPN
jgi:hypothetical protein